MCKHNDPLVAMRYLQQLNIHVMTKEATTWYFLDEDCRKDCPKAKHCARCKKTLREFSRKDSYYRIALHPIHMLFRKLDHEESVGKDEREGMIGSDCWKQIQQWGTYDFNMNQK